MDRSTPINLISVTWQPDAYGIQQPTETTKKIYANVKSVTRDEFFNGGRNGLNPDGQYSLFVLRPWDGTQEKLAAICAAADYGWEKYGLAPLFYTLEPSRDAEITRTAAGITAAVVFGLLNALLFKPHAKS